MISFEPSEDQQLILGTVADFTRASVAPRAREVEGARAVSDDVRRAVAEMGLGAAHVPEALGGQGLGLLTAALINEELGFGDAATCFGLPAFGAFSYAVLELASEEQARALLAPLCDPSRGDAFASVAWSERAVNRERAGFTTLAAPVDGGFELTGRKCFVQNVELAERFVVFAQVEAERGWDGLGAFVVAKGDAGLSVGERHRTLGVDCGNFGELGLEKVRVASSERLMGGSDFTRATLRFFAKYSLIVAARQVGLGRAAFDVAREYCDIRKAFGKPIGHFQAVAFTLADRHMDVESAREMVRRAAWMWDAGKDEAACLLATAHAAAHAHEVAMRAADDAVQLHGGAGFMRDVIVEKMMRDAKQMSLVGMTPEQLDQLAARITTGQPLDAGAVLPTPETQAIFT